ncbi:cysteine--tRNA ligase [Candidatus Pacearchaeota archaeon CG10_big_fil_rev_8_21_14_0_10_34_76]|nr:MAG: cysteine--tRNA ligase [Candidatus Pacearchaeota archaeon CG10_big_fil_rev_8_21_14_0_10_34_76]
MVIKFYNTLTRKKEDFKPIKKGYVGIYTCGPTVYWYQHIGNMRSYIFSDILKRVLLFNGFKVKHIINVTDVGHLTSDADEGEDKLEKAARKEGKNASVLAKHYFDAFIKDAEILNIIMPDKWPKATEHIKEQIELIKKLEKKDYTYKTSDGIYFDSSKFKNYGELAKLNIKELKTGKRVAFGEKKNKTDFALWKFSSPDEKRQQEWKSPWGIGFPGWHLECSAMSMKYLGERFDIHTGGQDHIPVHHTNEIAQSEAATGKKFVNYWLHGAFLLNSDGKKVSKSTGGLYTISELELQGYKPEHFRYLCLQTHYGKPLHFSLDALEAAGNAYEKIKRKVIELKAEEHNGNDLTKEYHERFLKAVNDDFNMPQALEVLWSVLDDFDFSPKKKIKLLEKFDEVLGLGVKDMKEEKFSIPKEVKDLLKEREKYRKEKQWEKADELRKMIEERGFIIEDKSDGAVLRKN